MRDHSLLGHQFRRGATVPQARSRDRVERATANRTPVQCVSVSTQRDAIRSKRALQKASSTGVHVVGDFTPNDRHEARLGSDLWGVL